MPRLVVFLLGFGIGLAGDACHVASGTTAYDWDGVPTLWNSAIWFPFVVGLAVLAAAEAGHRLDLPSHARTRVDVVIGAAVVLALYALTATLRGQPTTVAVVLCGAIAVAVWAWWDPTSRSLAVAVGAAILGPVAEMGVVASGAAHYAERLRRARRGRALAAVPVLRRRRRRQRRPRSPDGNARPASRRRTTG